MCDVARDLLLVVMAGPAGRTYTASTGSTASGIPSSRDVLPRKAIRRAEIGVVHLRPSRLDRSQSQACNPREDRVVADNRGIADVAAIEQPLHTVRRDRFRDAAVAPSGGATYLARPKSACCVLVGTLL